MGFAVMVLALMVVLPVVSTLIEALAFPGAALVSVAGKWFVFWGVGMRLLTAGLRQISRPEFTAKTIFQITDPKAFAVVSELGVSNVAIGIIALASIYLSGWTIPAALYGAVFYGVAGIRHLGNQHRNAHETVATYSDLWIAVILACYLIIVIVATRPEHGWLV